MAAPVPVTEASLSSPSPPISSLKASNGRALAALILPALLAGAGVTLARRPEPAAFAAGTLLLSVFFLQTFILLHECGHAHFFRSRFLNRAGGHLFGFLSLIPFTTWVPIHNLHHRWTGWRDRDPTTEKTIRPPSSRLLRGVVNLAWALFIPLFFLAYQLGNYWSPGKLRRFLGAARVRRVLPWLGAYLLAYGALAALAGSFLLTVLAPAFALSLIWKELVILTQHTHVAMPLAGEEQVAAFPYLDQVRYTRSFYVPTAVAELLLLNFNLHEAHHAFPGIPAYRLGRLELGLPRQPSWFAWFRQAKALSGVDFVFKTSADTGRRF